MDCVYCNYPKTCVVETKLDDRTNQNYRRRECVKCGARFSTREHMRDDYKYKGYQTTPPKLANSPAQSQPLHRDKK